MNYETTIQPTKEQQYLNSNTGRAGKTPNYALLSKVSDGHWFKIGVAWENKNGISITLNALPLTRHLFLKDYKTREEQEKEGYEQNY